MGAIPVTVRVDENNKKEAAKILDGLGLNMTTAINVFLAQVVKRRAIPFEIAEQPQFSDRTLAAIAEGDAYLAGEIDLPRFGNNSDFEAWLDS